MKKEQEEMEVTITKGAEKELGKKYSQFILIGVEQLTEAEQKARDDSGKGDKLCYICHMMSAENILHAYKAMCEHRDEVMNDMLEYHLKDICQRIVKESKN